MAKTKSTSKGVTIPAADRKAVTQYRGWMIAEGKKDVTDERAYQLLLKVRKKTEAERKETAAARVKEQAADKRQARESANESIDPAIMKLGEVRDLLKLIESGDTGGATDSAMAMFARAALTEAATELEQALFDLGVLKKGEHDYRFGGWFVGKIEGGANAEVQKTSQVTQ